MTSPEEAIVKRLDAPPLLDLADDLLACIFLRLPTLADVGRAATVCCSAFRRVIAGRSFLRCLRSVHRAPCLGFLHVQSLSFYPADAPHPSALYARALARAADFSFSFSFLPSGGPWYIQDVRNGRVLLQKSLVSSGLAVADPVSQRYILLPTPPILDDLAVHTESFLVPASGDDEPTSFRVICMAVCSAHLVAYVFSSASGGDWSAFPFQGWSAFAGNASTTAYFTLSRRYCVDGCLYWRFALSPWNKKLLVLDMRRMEFSLVIIPRGEYGLAIVEAAGDGSAEMFTIDYDDDGGRSKCLYSTRQIDRVRNSWQPKKKVQVHLPSNDGLVIVGVAERYLLLQRSGASYYSHRTNNIIPAEYFLLDLERMQLEKMCELDEWFLHVNLYTGFPPSLSHPCL